MYTNGRSISCSDLGMVQKEKDKGMETMRQGVPLERIGKRILLLRGHKVMLDGDLADLYGVTTFNLNKAVKRNRDRFPEDFAFQLSQGEYQALIFQSGISKAGRGGSRFLPYAFTEQGVAMISSQSNFQRTRLPAPPSLPELRGKERLPPIKNPP